MKIKIKSKQQITARKYKNEPGLVLDNAEAGFFWDISVLHPGKVQLSAVDNYNIMSNPYYVHQNKDITERELENIGVDVMKELTKVSDEFDKKIISTMKKYGFKS